MALAPIHLDCESEMPLYPNDPRLFIHTDKKKEWHLMPFSYYRHYLNVSLQSFSEYDETVNIVPLPSTTVMKQELNRAVLGLTATYEALALSP